MKNYILPIGCIFCLTFAACEDETTLETIDELTVQAFLHAGQTLDTVTFGKVIPLDSLEAEAAPDDLLPVVKSSDGETFPLHFLGETGKYGNADLLIEVGKTYSLEVSWNGKIVSAETFVPAAPQGVTLTDTIIERKKITSFQDLQNMTVPDPIEVNWQGEAGAWYFVSVKNIEADPEPVADIQFGGSGVRPDFLTEPSSNVFYVINTFRDITHFGKYEVKIFRVNPEYVALYEDNTSGTGSLNEIRTNVLNGYGIFTGVNSTSVFFEVKKE